jgi:LysM repeat protein
MGRASLRSAFKRCPACNSRCEASAASCEICGHVFGETQAIPRAEIERQVEREKLQRDQAEPKAQKEQPRQPTASRYSLDRKRFDLSRLPWGVIGVVAVIAGIGLGVWSMLRNRIAAPSISPPTIVVAQLKEATSTVVVNQTTTATSEPTATPAPASPTLPPPPPTRTPIPPEPYSIQSGDTCGGIASKFNLPLSSLLAFNNLSEVNCTTLRIGQTLLIPPPTPTPGPTETAAPNAAPAAASQPVEPQATLPAELVHIVKFGDTCSELAERYQVSIDDIIRQNDLDRNCLITLNQKLNIKRTLATPTVQPTAFVLATPTSRTGYPAPVLLAPINDAQLEETREVATLQWLTVGLLKPDEYYVVQVQPAGANSVPIFETKTNSLKLTRDILGDQLELSFAWWVQVKRRIAIDPNSGNPVYNNVSPPSLPRRFTWRKPKTAITPTPS